LPREASKVVLARTTPTQDKAFFRRSIRSWFGILLHPGDRAIARERNRTPMGEVFLIEAGVGRRERISGAWRGRLAKISRSTNRYGLLRRTK